MPELPRFRISSISVAASYDELDPALDPRPTPQAIDDLLTEKVSEFIDLAAAEAALQALDPVEGADAKAAVLEFETKVEVALNDAKIDENLGEIGLGGTTPYYKHTSSGTHEAVNWIEVKDALGQFFPWTLDIQIDGVTITCHVALCFVVVQVATSAALTPVVPQRAKEVRK